MFKGQVIGFSHPFRHPEPRVVVVSRKSNEKSKLGGKISGSFEGSRRKTVRMLNESDLDGFISHSAITEGCCHAGSYKCWTAQLAFDWKWKCNCKSFNLERVGFEFGLSWVIYVHLHRPYPLSLSSNEFIVMEIAQNLTQPSFLPQSLTKGVAESIRSPVKSPLSSNIASITTLNCLMWLEWCCSNYSLTMICDKRCFVFKHIHDVVVTTTCEQNNDSI